ncbi:MAG: class I SAM-dependent methyltransferase [Deltaproteobacteria bacterium]|jgi:ubiquinone/menaquinone biosynthesis C-methylase UbiE|nr:class I SAM-dependent methyltransferase [Deltaproteobacteria bacterium]
MTTASDPAHERLRAFRARNQRYLDLGHDRARAARFIVESAPSCPGPALDVGTGKGLLAVALAQKGLDVVSVDVDVAEQALARLLAGEAGVDRRIHFLHGDAARLSYPEEHFGCAAMMDVLHHLADPGPVLREMARVLRRGGVAILADFDEEGFALVARVHRDEGGAHARTATTVPLARDMLLAAGFRCSRQTRGCLHDVAVLTKP